MRLGIVSGSLGRDGNPMNNLKFQHKWKYNLSPAFFKTLKAWLIIVYLIVTASATSVTTNAPTSVNTAGATFNGNLILTTSPTTVWFEYTGVSGSYMFKTPDQTMTSSGVFSNIVSGIPLQVGHTYYYRAGANDGTNIVYGSEQNFITSPPLPQQTSTFGAHLNTLINAKMNITQMTSVTPLPYTDIMGSIFWGLLFGVIFLMIFMRQEDITLPSELGLLIGASLWALMPPEWVSMAYSLTIVSFAGLMYSLLKKP